MPVPIQSPYVRAQFRKALRLRSVQGRLFRRPPATTPPDRSTPLPRAVRVLALGLSLGAGLLAWLLVRPLETVPPPPPPPRLVAEPDLLALCFVSPTLCDLAQHWNTLRALQGTTLFPSPDAVKRDVDLGLAATTTPAVQSFVGTDLVFGTTLFPSAGTGVIPAGPDTRP
jgi:hypothetical protein